MKDIHTGAEALVMDEKDHVATAIRDLQAGEAVSCMRQGELLQVAVLDPIPLGHKIAIADIPEGAMVRKYGEVIGRATADIERGRHVHVHNVEGIRGRGDRKAAEKAGSSGSGGGQG